MAGKNVNIWIENWHWTGSDVATPQAQVDIRLKWIGDDEQAHDWEGTATFPNDLQLVPVAWVREALEDLIVRAARVRLNIDSAEE